jgi:hypothetical protein
MQAGEAVVEEDAALADEALQWLPALVPWLLPLLATRQRVPLPPRHRLEMQRRLAVVVDAVDSVGADVAVVAVPP